MENPFAISVKNLTFSYNSIPALNNVSINFDRGCLTAIVGPNGAGKSTLLKLIAGLNQPTSGTITKSINSPQELGYLPQQKELDRTFPLRVIDVVAMGFWPQMGVLNGLPRKLLPKINETLQIVGLVGFEKRSLDCLSGGQLQRLLFARLIIQEASIILLDEPFAAVDHSTTLDLLKIIQKWHKMKKTIIVISHDLELVKKHFPMTLLLSKTVIDFGPTQSVLNAENMMKLTFSSSEILNDQ